jgi:tetratricopeptide (TPR) repeat protein
MTVKPRIPRFQLRDEVGSGASGTIYQAVDEASGEQVAVKVIRPLGHVDAARFAREVRVLAKVRHPGVVRYVDHGHTADGAAYLVMEWLEGEDLRERLGRAGLTMNETVAMGKRVAGALEAVHAEGLVHRDVKPGNIFLPSKRPEDAKIIDFGLARADEAATAVTQTGLVVGTPAYMAPEQARGQREVDGRADVFSLGCVLYKCLSGRQPFEGSSVMAVLTKVLLDDPPRLRALRPDMPAALDALIASMLHKDPAHRPQGAAAVAEALGALGPLGAVGESSESAPPSRAFSGLTDGEQRVMAMVFIGAGAEETVPESGLRTMEAAEDVPEAQAAVGALAREHGGQLDRLADGTSVVTLSSAGVATDQAARAAKLALALRAVLPGVPMALATGQRDVARRFPMGDAIDRAARLLGRSAEAARSAQRAGQELPSAIAVDAVTAALLGARFDVLATDGGLSLQGPRAMEIGARTLLGRTTPMVGREWELSSLETLFFDCVEERQARAVLVTAPAGMGKSRLGHEAVRALRRRVPGLEVWIGRGDPLRAQSALGLLGDVIRSACGLREGEPLVARQNRLVASAGKRVPAQTAEFLGEIVEAPFPDESSSALRAARSDPRLMSERIRAAWEALIAATCDAGPLLVVLEDLHWADLATIRFVEGALSSLERRPWMVLGLARPEVHARFPRLWVERHVQEIRLKPLPRRAGEKLVRQVLGESADPETVSRVLGKAEGNAFYLEELIRAVAQDAGAGPLPETVLAMVQARLEGVDAEARRVLRAASVFGDVLWSGGVAALLGDEPPAGWEEGLLAREWLARRPESRFPGERELGFRHALLREGAYATLTDADRALGHQLAGEWLLAHGERDGMVLAQHFALAGEAFRGRAAGFFLAAAGQALRGGDPGSAIARVDRALAEVALPDEDRTQALILRCEAHAWRSDWAHAAADASVVVARAAPGSAAWIHANTVLQTASFASGQPLTGLSALAALASVEPAPEAAGSVVPALSVGVLVLCLAAQFEMARGVLDRAREMVARAEGHPSARAWYALGRTFWVAWREGDFWGALGEARTARGTFAEAGDDRNARFAQLFVAMCLWSLGMLDEAEAELRALPASGGEHLMALIGSLYLTAVLIDRGALAEARALAEKRLADAGEHRPGDEQREAEARWLLGEIAAEVGDAATAERELAASLEGLRSIPLDWQLAAARLASIRLSTGRVDEALALAREARDAQRAQGGYGQRGALVRLIYAEALAAAGQHEASRAEIREAHADLMARAARIVDGAVRQAFLSVREHARLVTLAAQ